MITYETTRPLSVFEARNYTTTEYYTVVAVADTADRHEWRSTYHDYIVSNGVVSSFSSTAMAATEWDDTYTYNEYAATLSVIGFSSSASYLTVKNWYASAEFLSSKSTTWQPYTMLVTTTSSTSSSVFYVSTNYTFEATVYTKDGTNIGTTTSAKSSIGLWYPTTYSDYEYGGTTTGQMLVSSSRTYSYLRTTYSSVTLSAPYEIGTIILAQGDERFYSFTHVPSVLSDTDTSNDGIPSFLSDHASSFTQQTFYPVLLTSQVSLLTYLNDASTGVITNPATTTGVTYYLPTSSAGTVTYTVTTGNKLPRETTTVSYQKSTLSSFSNTFGYSSWTMTAFTALTYIESTTLSEFSTTESTYLARTNGDSTTSTYAARTTTTASYTFTQRMWSGFPRSYYQGSYTRLYTDSNYYEWAGSWFLDSTYGVFNGGATSSWVSVVPVVVKPIRYSTEYMGDFSYYQPVPQAGGMKAPNAMKQSNNAGTNIGLSPAIYYPFVSSVQRNVVVPVVYKATSAEEVDGAKTVLGVVTYTYSGGSFTYMGAKYTDVTAWRYRWKDFVLSWTRKTTNSSTRGETTGTASMTIQGAATASAWANGGYLLGGYLPVSTAPEIAVRNPAGRKVSIISTDGSYETTQSIWTNYSSTTEKHILRVERTVPVYYTTTASTAAPAIGFYNAGNAYQIYP